MTVTRALLHLDAFLALVAGVLCVAAPQVFVASFYTEPLAPPGLAFVRLLGTLYAFYAVLEWGGLARGDRRFWSIFLPAALAGDAAHVIAFAHGMREPSAYWGFAAWFNVVLVAFFMSLRVRLIRDVRLTDRAPSPAVAAPVPEVSP